MHREALPRPCRSPGLAPRLLAAVAVLAALMASGTAFAQNLCMPREYVDQWLGERGYRIAFSGRLHHRSGPVPFYVWLDAGGRFVTTYTLGDGLIACQGLAGAGWHEAGKAIPRSDLRP